jgi:hypothetical protein
MATKDDNNKGPVLDLIGGTKKKKAAPAAAPAAASAADDEQTIVAIATAAIAAERGDSECAFKVISVTKIQ